MPKDKLAVPPSSRSTSSPPNQSNRAPSSGRPVFQRHAAALRPAHASRASLSRMINRVPDFALPQTGRSFSTASVASEHLPRCIKPSSRRHSNGKSAACDALTARLVQTEQGLLQKTARRLVCTRRGTLRTRPADSLCIMHHASLCVLAEQRILHAADEWRTENFWLSVQIVFHDRPVACIMSHISDVPERDPAGASDL